MGENGVGKKMSRGWGIGDETLGSWGRMGSWGKHILLSNMIFSGNKYCSIDRGDSGMSRQIKRREDREENRVEKTGSRGKGKGKGRVCEKFNPLLGNMIFSDRKRLVN